MEGKTILVSAGIIKNQDKILIAKRKNDASLEASKWEFPGGKVELFEDPKNTLKREIKEELDLNIIVGDLFEVVSYNYEAKKLQIIMITYFAEFISGTLKNIVHEESKWVTIDKLSNYDFAGADKPIVKKLLDKEELLFYH